jgi:hypothetical protein
MHSANRVRPAAVFSAFGILGLRFEWASARFNADRLIEFFEALIKDASAKIFLSSSSAAIQPSTAAISSAISRDSLLSRTILFGDRASRS